MLEKVAKCSFSVIARKNRPKELVESAYKRIRQAVIDKRFEKVEVGLRYLRTSRIMLAHDYCSDIESVLFLDAIKVELLNEVNQIRRRAYLLPRDAMPYKVPLPKHGEHSFAAYSEEQYQDTTLPYDWEFYNADKKQITDFWKLPDFYECCTLAFDLQEY